MAKVGRPRRARGETYAIAVRVTAKEHAAWSAAARAADVSLGEWIRAAAAAALPRD